MIKIGITGTHGSGKTKKAIGLMEHYTFLGNKVNMVDEVARSCPYSLKTITGQEWIWEEQMIHEKAAMSSNADIVICDRTAMDNLIYYYDVIMLQKLKSFDAITKIWGRWHILYEITSHWMPTYDKIIRMPINLEYLQKDDPIRSKDIDYAWQIDKLFDKFIDDFVTDDNHNLYIG